MKMNLKIEKNMPDAKANAGRKSRFPAMSTPFARPAIKRIHLLTWIIVALLIATDAGAEAIKPGEYYVKSNTLAVHSSPDPTGAVKSRLCKRDQVKVYEVTDGWARISRYYGRSVKGEERDIADWVNARQLSVEFPPVDLDSPLAVAIEKSDHYSKYHVTFIAASEKLICANACDLRDFKSVGGWWRAAGYPKGPVYFTYCGGVKPGNGILLNADTGKTFR